MELKFILEAILFSAQKPLSLKEIRDVFATAPDHAEGNETVRGLKKVKEEQLTAALEELAKEHETANRSYRLACVAGSWQFVTQPDYAPWLKALVGHKARPPRLSQPALETLAIIAYRQPLTRTEIEQVRGVAVDGVMQTLLERGLVEQVGRAEVIGRPMTYGTTPVFLEYFGLRALEELPAADELRRIPVQTPEALATAEPELPIAAEGQPAPAAQEQPPAEGQEPAEEPKPAEAPDSAAESTAAEAPPERAPASEAEAAAPEESPETPESTSPPEAPQS
ncbi:MAG TPA: SMC-Scp complex subunit ScpB [Bacillota bacterium]|nr:SMC-Scp complex subunit ScpB [Bacillota bacterium]